MVGVLQCAGICLTALLLVKLLGRYAPEQAALISMGTLCLVLLPLLLQVTALSESVASLLSLTDADPSYSVLLFKALGICLLTQLAAELCRDSGENALASAVLLGGKTELLMLCLPLLDTVVTQLRELLL